MTNAESETNKGTSKLLTAERMWNLSETFVVRNRRQDFRSETLLVETKYDFGEEIHLAMSEHLIAQSEDILDYTMTETTKQHRSLAFASKKHIVEKPTM